MGKGKPRHNPNKPQNKYGSHCKLYESDGGYYCPSNLPMEEILKRCKCNRHNCCKLKYQKLASS